MSSSRCDFRIRVPLPPLGLCDTDWSGTWNSTPIWTEKLAKVAINLWPACQSGWLWFHLSSTPLCLSKQYQFDLIVNEALVNYLGTGPGIVKITVLILTLSSTPGFMLLLFPLTSWVVTKTYLIAPNHTPTTKFSTYSQMIYSWHDLTYFQEQRVLKVSLSTCQVMAGFTWFHYT